MPGAAAVFIATRQMADLLSGGLPLTKSLDIVARQSRSRAVRDVFSAIRRDLEAGSSLSDALASRSDTFTPLYVGLVRSGESTGAMDRSFLEIARQLEIDGELRQRARSALVYPCLVLILAAGICLFLTGFVIPRFQLLFADLGQRLPLPTRFLIWTGSAVRDNGIWTAAACAGVALAFPELPRQLLRKGLEAIFSISLVREQLTGRFVERWAHLMSALTRHGYPVGDALALTRRSLHPNPLAPRLVSLETGIQEGQSLSQSIHEQSLFPPMVAELVGAGEESGRLDDALERVASALGRESEASLKLALTLLEPALILFVAAVVGFVAVAMLLPIFEMSANVR